MPDMGQRLPCRQTTKQPARPETDIFRAGRLNEFVNNLHKSNTALQGILFCGTRLRMPTHSGCGAFLCGLALPTAANFAMMFMTLLPVFLALIPLSGATIL